MFKMHRSRFSQMLIIGIQRIQDPYYNGFAAQIAFYLLLSMVPLVIVLSQLLNFFDVPISYAYYLVERYVPGGLGDSLNSWFITDVNPVKSNIVFICLALWAGSRALFCVTRITNYTMTVGKSTGRSYFSERFRSLLTLIITVFTVAFTLIILAYGQTIIDVIYEIFNLGAGGKQNEVDTWMRLRWPVAFALYFFMISYNYYVLPTDKMKFREILPGSIFSSVGMLVVTYFYSIYNNYVFTAGNYNILYGSLASIVAMMFWFYFLAWVICLGVLCNKLWMDTKPVKDTSKL